MFKGVLVLLLLCIFNQVRAQHGPHQVVSFLSQLEGSFSWEIQKPSSGKVTRTGLKQSTFKLDSLVLYTEEQFDDSEIEHLAIMGWDEENARFFSVGVYNIDPGPHLMFGKPDTDLNRVVFTPNDSSKVILNVDSRDEYFWTYQSLKLGKWVSRDLKITFKRIH